MPTPNPTPSHGPADDRGGVGPGRWVGWAWGEAEMSGALRMVLDEMRRGW